MPSTLENLAALAGDRMHARTLPVDPSAEEAPTLVGCTLAGRYLVEKELGRGGMGHVFAARDLKLDRAVAIKFLGDSKRLAQVEQEARAVSAINHPNVIAIYDLVAVDEGAFIIFELLEGDTLRRRLDEPIPLTVAVDLASQLALALDATHRLGIVHSDLKPENLFISGEGRLKILDFGLARGAASTGPISGTLGYMSPEQIRGEPVDPRADVFAFGAVVYEMLAGHRAFEGATPGAIGEASMSGEPGELPETVPLRLDRLVRRCLRKRAIERHAAVREIAAELQAVLKEMAGEKPGEKAAAYDWYLKGRYFFSRRPAETREAVRAFERALQIDPAYAPAYAGLADAYATLGSWENGGAPPREAMPVARQMAERALSIDARLAAPHAALG